VSKILEFLKKADSQYLIDTTWWCVLFLEMLLFQHAFFVVVLLLYTIIVLSIKIYKTWFKYE